MLCTVISVFLQTVAALAEDEKTPKDYGTGHLLSHGEVNFLEAVKRYPKANAVELAGGMKVTRGAIAQMGKKLEQRGFVTGYQKSCNKKEKYYMLTTLGQELIEGHQLYHHAANQEMCDYIKTLSAEQTKAILHFLDKLKEFPVCAFECHGNCMPERMNDKESRE